MIVGGYEMHLYCDDPKHSRLPLDYERHDNPAIFYASSGRANDIKTAVR